MEQQRRERERSNKQQESTRDWDDFGLVLS